MENWKKIIGFDQYEVSDLGNVKSVSNPLTTRKEKILRKGTIKNGYNIVVLTKYKKQNTIYVHRLVADAFIKNKEDKKEVNHINGVKTDNRVENLEWMSTSENAIHAFRNNLSAKGQDRTQAKLTDVQVLEIKKSGLRNIELSRKYNISKSIISGIQRGRLWRHISE